MKKTILVASASVLALSTSVFAAPLTQHTATTFQSNAFSDQGQAKRAGEQIKNKFANISSQELRDELPILAEPQSVDEDSIEINDMNIQVKEVALSNNDVQYRAIVDVDYNYTYNRGGQEG